MEQVPAKKNSKNRLKGSLSTETVDVNRGSSNSVTMDIEKILPAIIEKWPAWEERIVGIQFEHAPCRWEVPSTSGGLSNQCQRHWMGH